MDKLWNGKGSILLVTGQKSNFDLDLHKKELQKLGVNSQLITIVFETDHSEKTNQENNVNPWQIPFSLKDKNFFGKITNTKLLNLLSNRFDLILFVGDIHPKLASFATKLKSNFKVGVDQVIMPVNLNLKTIQKDTVNQLNFVKETLDKLELE